MSFVDTSAGEGPRLRAWAAAFTLVLALHGLVVLVLLGRPIADSAAEAPPAPIMIDLPPIESTALSLPSDAAHAQSASAPASMVQPEPVETEAAEPVETTAAEPVEAEDIPDAAPPVAPETVRADAPPDPAAVPPPPSEVVAEAPSETAAEAPPVEAATDAPPSPAVEVPPEAAEPVPDAAVAEIPPEEIVPDTPDPEALVAAEPKPAVPLPPERPAAEPPPRPVEAERPPEPARPVRSAERNTVRAERTAPKRPAAPTRPSPASAPSAASAGGRPDPTVLGRYRAQVQATLERRKTIPAGAERARGPAVVRFSLERGGRVLAAQLVTSSGSSALDQAALAMVRQGGFPAAPAELTQPRFTFSFPFRFSR